MALRNAVGVSLLRKAPEHFLEKYVLKRVPTSLPHATPAPGTQRRAKRQVSAEACAHVPVSRSVARCVTLTCVATRRLSSAAACTLVHALEPHKSRTRHTRALSSREVVYYHVIYQIEGDSSLAEHV